MHIPVVIWWERRLLPGLADPSPIFAFCKHQERPVGTYLQTKAQLEIRVAGAGVDSTPYSAFGLSFGEAMGVSTRGAGWQNFPARLQRM
jgi:hypothetical protein